MNLVDLAYTSAELKHEKAEAVASDPEMPAYPWGLQIRLEEEELAKLGIKDLPQVGGELHMTVIAKVTGVSENQMADGERECCVTLQITMASVDMQETAAEEKGEVVSPAAEMREMRKTVSLLGRY